jgi:hypothetical protein
MSELQGRVSGIALPKLICDTPGGKGKVPVGRDYVVARAPGRTTLETFRGERVDYIDPPREASEPVAASVSPTAIASRGADGDRPRTPSAPPTEGEGRREDADADARASAPRVRSNLPVVRDC